MTRRSGRRPGKQDTRETILTAARDAFAEHGYDRATVRQIATSAGVDPALVHHYFGSKEKLFAATIDFPFSPAEILDRAFADGPDGAGERLVRTFLTVWDSPAGAAGVALFRSAVSNPLAARLLREFLTTQLLRHAMARLGIDPAQAQLRGALIASQLSGLAVTRYVLQLEPIATAPAETVVAAIGPTVQRYLTGELPSPPPE
ncbi:TetR family transcriptional regulator [Natronosporangium hydrolyticum]|uniref:TetR family transcriptional regulator n=1 Tax=Natronosporangium hydrolyticum TaxID=2811111 RepID=A0A895YK12_9ACTN|nr:TetR family transcriptional regulator [Natronosporangium hydrolyticum]QSB16372.1 TetR family transcriptional regulator [Natronosporangium hydrolyticum]